MQIVEKTKRIVCVDDVLRKASDNGTTWQLLDPGDSPDQHNGYRGKCARAHRDCGLDVGNPRDGWHHSPSARRPFIMTREITKQVLGQAVSMIWAPFECNPSRTVSTEEKGETTPAST